MGQEKTDSRRNEQVVEMIPPGCSVYLLERYCVRVWEEEVQCFQYSRVSVFNRSCTSGDAYSRAGRFKGMLKSAWHEMLVLAFNAAIGYHKADSSFNLFNQKKLLYNLSNIL